MAKSTLTGKRMAFTNPRDTEGQGIILKLKAVLNEGTWQKMTRRVVVVGSPHTHVSHVR